MATRRSAVDRSNCCDRIVIRCFTSGHPATGNRVQPRADAGRKRPIGVAPWLLKQSETSG